MISDKDKAECVLWLAETKSLVSVRRRFRCKFGREPLHLNSKSLVQRNWKCLLEKINWKACSYRRRCEKDMKVMHSQPT
jgi:hypothetical protein